MAISFLNPKDYSIPRNKYDAVAFITCDVCGTVLRGDSWDSDIRKSLIVCTACASAYRNEHKNVIVLEVISS